MKTNHNPEEFKIVAPQPCIVAGISGAIQHLPVHEGFQGDRGDQLGPRGPDLLDRRLRLEIRPVLGRAGIGGCSLRKTVT
jgi:hypothetical protein